MATKVKNIRAIKIKVKKLYNGFTNDSTEMEKVATAIQNSLRESIREGQTAKGDLKGISSKWSNYRAKLIAAGKVKNSKYYAKGFANATLSGELVRNIFAIVKGKYIELFANDKAHAKYKRLTDRRSKKKSKNTGAKMSEIVAAFRKRGDELLFVPDSATEKIKNLFLRYLRRKRS